mmetsp:Transcript_200/g.288  ORF Transcript_200/g.288 Transcript_200/m.288 type:complete len:114 (+) Transcript_200:50-391(+)
MRPLWCLGRQRLAATAAASSESHVYSCQFRATNKKFGSTSDSLLQEYYAVVRYDNNVATVPFVGSQEKAVELKSRMTQNTHKHHIYVLPSSQPSVPLGPYPSMDKVKEMLKKE